MHIFSTFIAEFEIGGPGQKLVSPLRGLRELGVVTQGFRPGLDCAAPTGLVLRALGRGMTASCCTRRYRISIACW
jgi:hypothetical protein